MRTEEFVERRIVTGLIVSAEYARRIAPFWRDDYIGSSEMSRVAGWCLDYLERYDRVPGRDIQSLYMDALKFDQMARDEAELIQVLLERISDEFERSDADAFNVGYLFDQTVEHIRDRELRLHNEEVEDLRERGRIDEAEALRASYVPFSPGATRGLEVGSEEGYARIEAAFAEAAKPLVSYPGALGEMLSPSLTRGAFVAFLAPEKRGKCLAGSQLVLMSNGETLPIREVVARRRGDIVSYDEQRDVFVSSGVSDFHVNGPKRVWEVTTRTGRRVRPTSGHPFLTPDGWRELRHIGVGQYVAVPKNIPIFGSDVMPVERVKLLAYFIADGSLGNENDEAVGFTKADPDIKRDFEECVERMGCAVRWSGIDGRVVNSLKNKHKHDRNYVKLFLREQGLMRRHSYDKLVPQSVYYLRRDQLALFLSVLITCDGWVDANDGGVGFAVANEPLARQVQELLSRFGIVSGLVFKPNDKRGAWCVTIRDYENIIRFGEQIGFLFGKKKKFEDVVGTLRPCCRSFLDKFPHAVAARFYADLELEFGVVGSARDRWDPKWCEFSRKFTRSDTIRGQLGLDTAPPIMRQSFDQMRDTVAGDKYLNSSILWDEVVSIEYVGIEETFDLTVDDHHNFVAENIIVHNTAVMLDLAFRSLRQKSNVAFFQAGDLTEGQFLRRIAIHVARRSDEERYCQAYWRPVGDCELNQHDDCDRADRECDHGVYAAGQHKAWLEDRGAFENLKSLSDLATQYPDYRPCDSSACRNRRPCVWLIREKARTPLTGPAASAAVRRFFERHRRRFRLATYASDTLTVEEVNSCLGEWERQDGFVPDVIVVDYADLIAAPSVQEFRHRQDAIWKGLRGLSQRWHALVVTATQADSDSYVSSLLRMKNFSEDKRKLGHVRAMYGLNQDPSGREKELGIIRVNPIVVGEGAFSVLDQVIVLQDLRTGRPFVESFVLGQSDARHTFDMSGVV